MATAGLLIAQPAPKKPTENLKPDPAEPRVVLTAAEYQKLIDDLEQLKKQLALKKGVAPSTCAVRGRIERRGETVVAALRITYKFRTTAPGSAVCLGGRKGFLVKSSLDGPKIPVIDVGEDGFVALVDSVGDHTLVLDLECPVAGRGGKTEIGFELGLPRSAITTLILDPSGSDVRRVDLTTRTTDPTQPQAPATVRKVTALDVRELAPKPSSEGGYPLGPVDSLELTWDAPAGSTAPAESGVTAELEISCLLAEGFVDTTARIRVRGPGREWRFVAPVSADVSVDRVAEPGTSREIAAPVQFPTVNKPSDANKPIWKVEFPSGTAAADWVITAITRQTRPKPSDPRYKGPFAVGPFAVAGVARQTGSVRITAAGNTRLVVVKQNPDLRRAEPPAAADDDVTTQFYRLTTGPTGVSPQTVPLLEIEAQPMKGRVWLKPAYRLKWNAETNSIQIRLDVQVHPVRTEVNEVVIDMPAEWGEVTASPIELVEGVVNPSPKPDTPRQAVAVKLRNRQKLPFDLSLQTTIPIGTGLREAGVLLPRFPGAEERDGMVTAVVPEGWEVGGSAREWDDAKPAGWAQPLTIGTGPDGKPAKSQTTAWAKFETGPAKVDLIWRPHQPMVTVESRADVLVQDRQMVVAEKITFRFPEGSSRVIRLHGPAEILGLKVLAPAMGFDSQGAGEYSLTPNPEPGKETVLSLSYALPISARAGDSRAPQRVPVGLIWANGTTRTESTVRVWAGGSGGRAITPVSGGWRELPPEPAPERDSLPVATLAGNGVDLPLILEIRESTDGGTAVWVERAFIQAWAGEDGTTTYHARFLIRRWLSPSVELRLPAPVTGPNPDFLVDAIKVDPISVADTSIPGGSGRLLRIPLPESRTRPAVLDVWYKLPVAVSGEQILNPPLLQGTSYTEPVRWKINLPAGTVPLLLDQTMRPEVRWAWRHGLFVPTASESTESLDRWFSNGLSSDESERFDRPTPPPAEEFVFRQQQPGEVHLYRASRLLLVIVCSLVLVLVELGISRLPGGWIPFVLIGLFSATAVAALLYPQPTAQVGAAALPGQIVVVGLAAGIGLARFYRLRRIKYLPGFTRTVLPGEGTGRTPLPSGSGRTISRSERAENQANLPEPSSARSGNRPAPVGSTPV